MKKKFLLVCSMLLLSAAAGVRAEVPAPDELIRNTAREVLDIVRKDKDLQSGDQQKMLELVEAKVLPHFDFERMTRLAVGRPWRTATPEQKQALVSEFRTLLVRTYTAAFTSYRNQTVEVRPPRMEPEATDVTIKTSIVKPGGQQPISVDYAMAKSPDGWKVYDLTVEGVSLVTSYRGTFADQIQQAGIDGLIKTLVEKNEAAAADAATAKKDSK